MRLHTKSLCRKLDRQFAVFLAGTKSVEWFPRVMIHAPKSSGGLGLPSMWSWQLAIGANVRRRLLGNPTVWGQAMAPNLANPTCLFRLQTLLDPGDLRRPRQIVQLAHPDLTDQYWQDRSPWLLEGSPAADLLPLTSAKWSKRQVFDVKCRILSSTAVASFLPSSCPHCEVADSTEHRFWACRVAYREREHLFRLRPDLADLSKAALLLGKDHASEALLWRLHCLALSPLVCV